MRTLLILACTTTVMVTGCKTGNKNTSCATSCGGCAHMQVGAVTIQPAPKKVAAQPKPKAVVEVSHSDDKNSPFENLEDLKPALAVEPAVKETPVPKMSHDEKYRWLIGRLQRVHSPKHEWKLRYAPLDQHDQWGGSVVLAQDARLDDWNDGDLVYIEGEILNERPSVYLTGPLYRIRVIRPAEEAPAHALDADL